MSEDFIKIGAVRRYSNRGLWSGDDCFTRLQVAAESTSKEALATILSKVHEKAVELAPMRRNIAADPVSGLRNGKPEQLWAPGLLKNSIGYYITGEQKIHGLNSVGGKYRVSEDISVYPNSEVHDLHFGARKSAGTFQGFIGTFIMHRDYVNWDPNYTYDRLEKKGLYNYTLGRQDYERKTKKGGRDGKGVATSSADFTYGAYVEFNIQPFLRPALYSIVDSEEHKKIIARIFKRDIKQVMNGQIPDNGRYSVIGVDG